MKKFYLLILTAVITCSAISQGNQGEQSGMDTQNAVTVNNANTSTLPATLQTAISPSRLGQFRLSPRLNSVELSWDAFNENNLDKHEVEKSADGLHYMVIGAIKAQNNPSARYTFLDATPVNGINYYRLRSVGKHGEFMYSQALRINMGFGRADLVVSPNPVTNGIVNVQLTNLTMGKYNIRLFNSVGQQVLNRSMDHPGGSTTETLNLPANLGRGTYFLQLSNGQMRFNKQVVVN